MEAKKMSDETYNGWKNVETWVINLWLNNEKEYYDYVNNKIKGKSVYDASETIELIVKEYQPIWSGMFGDLINHALNQVDWLAIAKGFVEEN